MKVPLRKKTKKLVCAKQKPATLSFYECVVYQHLRLLPNDIKQLICYLASETIGLVLKQNKRIFHQIKRYEEIKNVNDDICGFCFHKNQRTKVLLVNNGKFSYFPCRLAENDKVKAVEKKLLIYKTSNKELCVCIDNKYQKVTILDGKLVSHPWKWIIMPCCILFITILDKFKYVLIDRKTYKQTNGTVMFQNSPLLLLFPLLAIHVHKDNIYLVYYNQMYICTVQNHELVITHSTSFTSPLWTNTYLFVAENFIRIFQHELCRITMQTFQISGNDLLYVDCQSKSIGKLASLDFPWFCHETGDEPFCMENFLTCETFPILSDGKTTWNSSASAYVNLIDSLFLRSNDDLIYQVYNYPKCCLCKMNLNDRSFKILHEYDNLTQVYNQILQTIDETVVCLSFEKNKTMTIQIQIVQ